MIDEKENLVKSKPSKIDEKQAVDQFRDRLGSKLTEEEPMRKSLDGSVGSFSPMIDTSFKYKENEELKKQAREFFNKPAIDERTTAEKKEVDEFFKKKDEAFFSDDILKKPIDNSFFTRMKIAFTELWNEIDFYFITFI